MSLLICDKTNECLVIKALLGEEIVICFHKLPHAHTTLTTCMYVSCCLSGREHLDAYCIEVKGEEKR